MKSRVLSTLLLLSVLCLPGRAQVFIINDTMLADRLAEVKAAVVDSLSGEPVPFASVYVIPSRDTTITNFTLSDAKGEATLDEVPFGSYVFHVEMMGYKPFVKEHFFREREVDLGRISLQQDEHFLQAATITDVGNPMVIKQDTVEFNASSFRVGANDMLKDLIKRMPGMEITDEGKVVFNGQAIDKLTVGGRTFFFDDQSAALNNLPAAIVDKIRVIDRESEATRATGVQDGTREKVLDVALKKEYEQGWFGNLALKGGTTVAGEAADDPLRDNRGLLYSGNALVSAYTEKDQVTFIANQQNVNDSNITVVFVSSDGSATTNLGQGLSTSTQLGLNANTSRIKNVETTVSASYQYTDTDSGTSTSRTTHQESGDLLSKTDNLGNQIASSISTNLELSKESGKVWFHLRPRFSYSHTDSNESTESETNRLGSLLNHSENTAEGFSNSISTGISSDLSLREIGGKKGRVIQFNLGGSYGLSNGQSSQLSLLRTADGVEDRRALRYLSDGTSRNGNFSIRYVEPVGEKWTLTTLATYDYAKDDNIRDAYDDNGLNSYYSSESRNSYLNQQYDFTAQYKFTAQTFITLGARASGTLNETFSKSYNIASTTGDGEWYWYTIPTFRFSFSDTQNRLTVSLTGYNRRPGASQMLPVLNVSNLSRLSVGNIYLKPYGYTSLSTSWTRNNREKFSNLTAYLTQTLNTNAITNALWYDSNGVLYTVPVNSKAPQLTTALLINYSTPLDENKRWNLQLGTQNSYIVSNSYQTDKTLDGLDKDSFDYSSFMDRFWGDEGGSRFYGGQSGFEAGKTITFSPNGSAGIRYSRDRFSFNTSASSTWRISRYSLDPSLDMTTAVNRFSVGCSYTTRKEWEFNSDISYQTYKGYSAGFDRPELQWNAEISKNIGAFNLSLSANDILNQTRNLSHDITANYEEDTYRLIMGRYILFGVRWNFGKMNAVHSQRAQTAALNMAL